LSEFLSFIMTTYILAGFFQGIIISIYEDWIGRCGCISEVVMGIILICFAWPILWLFEFIEWSQYQDTKQ